MGIVSKIILLACLVLFSLASAAQETPEVHKINGKKYYLHVVEKGNTMYGISRLYQVEIPDIMGANREALSDGLKENQTLLIPVTSNNKRELAPVKQDGAFLVHAVQPKETLYSISKKYNTTLETILEANPELKTDGLKADSKIKIPLNEVEVKAELTSPAQPDSLEGHVIQAGETFYAIAKQYGLEVKKLTDANPGMDVLRVGAILRIPGTSTPVIKVDSVVIDTGFVSTYVADSSGIFHIGLLLPIDPQYPDSATARNFKINPANNIALGYLRGFQFALDSLDEKYAATLMVHVYSVTNDTHSLSRVMKDPMFDSLDLVIGPFYTSQFEFVSDALQERGVLAICPINKPSRILFKRPNAIKTMPSESMQVAAMANFIAANYMDSNLVLVNSNKIQDTQNLDFFKQELVRAVGQADTVTDEVIPEIQLWDINSETLGMRFKDSGNYVLIVPSIDQVFVTRLVGGLYDFMLDAEGKYSFQVFGLEYWRNWEEGFSVRQLQGLGVTLPVTGYVDMKDYRVHAFFKAFYREHGFEPTAITMQAYDHCNYLFEELSKNPKTWFDAPEDYSFNGIHSRIYFRRVLENSGIENEAVDFYQYRNYQLNKIGSWPLTKTK